MTNPLGLTSGEIVTLRKLQKGPLSADTLQPQPRLLDHELLRKVEGPSGFSGHEISEKGSAYLARYDGATSPAVPPTCCQKCGAAEVFLPYTHGRPGCGAKRCPSCGTMRPWPHNTFAEALAAADGQAPGGEEKPTVPRCTYGVCPSKVHPRDWPQCKLDEGHSGKCIPEEPAAPVEPQERVIEVKQQIRPAQIAYMRTLGHEIKPQIENWQRRQLEDGGFIEIGTAFDLLTPRGRELLASLDKPAAEEPPRAPSPTPAEVEALVKQAREQGRIAGLKEAAEMLDRMTDESRRIIRQKRLDLNDLCAVRDAREEAAARLWAKVEP